MAMNEDRFRSKIRDKHAHNIYHIHYMDKGIGTQLLPQSSGVSLRPIAKGV